ncbi:response regulator [Lederbergia panacisoli]|uniref:response regulator n=1 Tax=Lederbergia panacisoli TaxID=1255251 RepID=UPI00214AFB15|nr:response regulator [Lederbergia panacisoli]MCR2822520.1 response regulator [Lederbergia panacisoli]
MYRILLVDDEAIERIALKKIITAWNDAIIEEAENGRTAIVKAAEFRPDIIFMDIKMPGIDGIEATSEIKKMDSNVKVIMVTAFEAFEYARHAVRLGVNDYLLKPSSDQEIIEVLTKVTNEIEIERHNRNDQLNLKENYNRALSIIQSRVITSLIVGNDVAEKMNFAENWTSVYEKTSFVIVLEFGDELSGDEKHKIANYISNQLSISENICFVGEIHLNQLPILIQLCNGGHDESIMSQSLKIGSYLIEKLQQKYAHTPVKIGIGTSYDVIEDFVQSYHEALFALAKTTRSFTCTYYNHLLSGNESIDQLFEREKTLLEHIVFGKLDETRNSFRKYFDELIIMSGGDLERIKEKINEFFVLLNRQMHERKVEVIFHTKYSDVKSMYRLQELVLDEIMKTTREVQTNHSTDNDLISKAKSHINEHYEKSITLEDVAEIVQFSPHYFSKLFKEQCGLSYIDYLTEVRVNHAKELMKLPEKSLKEICFQVGYKDPNYFSRVFKRVTGFSPSEYRSSQLKIGL